MEDGASEISSDWEVLSAASAPGGGDEDDVVLVSGEGGDVLHDHFALVPSPAGCSGEGSWPEAASDEEEKEGLELLDRSDSFSRERLDLAAVDSGTRLQDVGGVDETAESLVLGAAMACVGATWRKEESQVEAALDAEIEPDNKTALNCGELASIPQAAHQGVGKTLGLDATAVAYGIQIELPDDYNVQLADGGADVTGKSSVLQAAATGDKRQAAEEPEQGKDGSVASGHGESDGEVNDGSSPLVEIPGAGEGKGQVVVWWRLPFRLLHYCAWKARPVWSISIAAALLGLVVLGRRMYRMRRKAQGIPQIKIAFDDKRVSQFADRAARLNEAFLIAKRIPALRTSSGAVLPWSMVQER